MDSTTTTTTAQVRWSPALVEDLLFRQFIKNEDVSALLPPAPSVSEESYLDEYEQATRMLFAYVRNGPVSALAAHNVNAVMGNQGGAGTVGKSAAYYAGSSSAGRAPLSRTPPPPPSSGGLSNSKMAQGTAATTASSSSSSLPPPAAPPSGVTQQQQQHAMRTPATKPSLTASPAAAVISASSNDNNNGSDDNHHHGNNSSSSNNNNIAALSSACLSPLLNRLRRGKVEWPRDVPSNNALKSNSRSKVAHLTAQRVAAQGRVDPDLIFAQDKAELPLHTIFARYPNVLQSLSATRNASGDWRNDTFTLDEETLYKREMGYTHLGPSQCSYDDSTARRT